MKKYFVLSVLIMLIGAFTNVQSQNTVTSGNGVAFHTEVESPKGIIVTVPATYTVFSIVPIKNK